MLRPVGLTPSQVEFFYNDYEQASLLADAFDSQLSRDALAASGQDYLSIVSLAARQAFAGVEFSNTSGNTLVFLKEISSHGNAQTVDVIFPFHPLTIYTNSNVLKWMLDPLLINQESGHWPNTFSIHDLGSSFPNATGHNNGADESMYLHSVHRETLC